MVRTRHSLPTAGDGEDALPAGTETRELPKWMRDLKIDGKETLKGEKKDNRGLGVYTWRGAVYAIDENTPQEWIEAEAERVAKKKEREQREQEQKQRREREQWEKKEKARREKAEKERMNAAVRLKSETPARELFRSATLPPERQQSVRGESNEEEQGQEQGEERRPSNKRAFDEVEPEQQQQQQQQQQEEEKREGDDTVRVPKKPRKNLNSLKDKPAPPPRHYLFPTLNAPKKKPRSKPKPDVPRSAAGGEQTTEQGEQAVTKTKRGRPRAQPQTGQTPLPTPSPQLPDMPKSFTMPISEQDKQTLRRIVCNITEPEANRLAATIVEIGRINSRAHDAQARSEGVIEILRELKEKLRAKKAEEQQRQAEVQVPEQVQDRAHDPPPIVPPQRIARSQEMTPPAEEGAAENILSRVPSLTHDVVSEQSISSPTSFDLSALLPKTNRGGQHQKWSLTGETLHGVQLTSHRHGHGAQHAESAIYRGRLDGETPSARRRRIQREVAILDSLPSLLDNLSGTGPSANVGVASTKATTSAGMFL